MISFTLKGKLFNPPYGYRILVRGAGDAVKRCCRSEPTHGRHSKMGTLR
jgi:hypothetical protein